MQPNYLESVKEHAALCAEKLDKLSELMKEKGLNEFEYRASERYLQILIESSIGLAKQAVKDLKKVVPADAYLAFITLHDEKVITQEELNEWRKIIAVRNALVHEYLNIQREIIEKIIFENKYQIILNFFQKFN